MKAFDKKFHTSEPLKKALEILERLSINDKSTDGFYLSVISDLDETISELTQNVINQFKANPQFKNKESWLERLQSLRSVSTRLSALHSVSRQQNKKIFELEKAVMKTSEYQERIIELEKEVEKLNNVLTETDVVHG